MKAKSEPTTGCTYVPTHMPFLHTDHLEMLAGVINETYSQLNVITFTCIYLDRGQGIISNQQAKSWAGIVMSFNGMQLSGKYTKERIMW